MICKTLIRKLLTCVLSVPDPAYHYPLETFQYYMCVRVSTKRFRLILCSLKSVVLNIALCTWSSQSPSFLSAV